MTQIQPARTGPERIPLSDGWEGVIYREWSFPPDVIEGWDALAGKGGDIGIFLGYGWFEQWWKAFSTARSLFVVVLLKDGALKAVFPCCLNASTDDTRKREEISSLTNDHTCHYDFLIDTGHRHQAISHFVNLLRMSHPDAEMYFEYTPSKGENISAFIEELQRNGMPLHRYDGPWAPWLEITGDWRTFQGNLSARLKNTMRKCRKKAEAMGRLDFEMIRQCERLDATLDSVFAVEFKSWKGRDGTAIKCHPDVENFYRLLAHWAMRHNHLVLFVMRLNDTHAASVYCLISGQTVFGIKAGYDDTFGNISPGNLLYEDIFKFLYGSNDVKVYNFLGACDPWKMEWTQNSSEYGSIRVYPKSLRGWTDYNVKYGWKDFLKKFDAARQLKSWLDKEK